METDHQTLETTSDQVVCTSDDQGPSQARSYECTFCKRGFSTAQALGGHMNIHRKDKAKLKKASNEAQQYSLDITKPASLFSPIPTNAKDPLQAMYSEERSKIAWPNWIVSGEDDTTIRAQTRVGEPQKLTFLGETPSNTRDRMLTSQDMISTVNAGKGLSSGQGSSGAELDLELRLGPEPHGPSKATGTKKFF
uniref:C2H2-type domain-containing protein n=1 Tax=Vitis vinifera TaxID=29760 RepID=A5B464_VITVI|nr:hypothetical protein VITISV_043547 [Vitis vinifera]